MPHARNRRRVKPKQPSLPRKVEKLLQFKPLPDRIDRLRRTKWGRIGMLAYVQGDSLKRMEEAKRIIERYRQMTEKGKAGSNATIRYARALMSTIAILADEVVVAMGEKGLERSTDEWKKQYIEAMGQYWGNMPRALQREIVRQTREE
jgi:predicted NBD/HSP70 family sugar kinase